MLSLSTTSFFRNLGVFSALTPGELSGLVGALERFSLQPGDPLFDHGDPSDGMFVIERGEVGVFSVRDDGTRVLLAELGNGAVIGELSLIDGAPRSARVEAVAATTGYFLPRTTFEALRNAHDPRAYKLLFSLGRTLEDRRRVAEQRVSKLLHRADEGELTSREVRDIFGRILKG